MLKDSRKNCYLPVKRILRREGNQMTHRSRVSGQTYHVLSYIPQPTLFLNIPILLVPKLFPSIVMILMKGQTYVKLIDLHCTAGGGLAYDVVECTEDWSRRQKFFSIEQRLQLRQSGFRTSSQMSYSLTMIVWIRALITYPTSMPLKRYFCSSMS